MIEFLTRFRPCALALQAEFDQSDDVADVLHAHRLHQQREAAEARARDGADNVGSAFGGEDAETTGNLPPQLLRRFEVRLLPRGSKADAGASPSALAKAQSLREVHAEQIGHLVTVKGIVVRVSDVKPLVSVVTYSCDSCGFEIYQTVNGRTFMPLNKCPSSSCSKNRNSGRLHMQVRGSKFVKYQEIKIQELPEQVPVGHIPRSMTAVARGDLTRLMTPGEILTIDGIFTPTPYTGFKAMRAGLIADTYLECQRIVRAKKGKDDMDISKEMEDAIDEAVTDEDLYSKMARSIAPEIYGHEDVKKALLLQLVGGVTRSQTDGMKIRGDLNVCLMGDPGVAKSQLLKHISTVAPRGVYTTGKGSSGVGLTAAVLRDPLTKELTLEGGALVLADMGICCIDEFDKMEESDRTAIHEVMEQQTVSIAKAGITTTLNARTAILAAANPLFGRYNPRLSPTENINLPAALLSRFDLMFLILDRADADNDMALARHVTYVHKHGRHPELDFEPMSPEFIRAYVAQARRVEPWIPEPLTRTIVAEYVAMRQREAEAAKVSNTRSVMTARALLSILRMAQALARLRFATEVGQADIDEAIRLVAMSKASLVDDDAAPTADDPISRIYSLIRDYAAERETTSVRLGDVEPMALKKGFTAAQFRACLDEYAKIDIWQLNADNTHVTFVQ